MSDPDQTVLFEQFVAAREQAILLTDRFATIEGNHSTRDELWQHVMRQTDTARLLLERWLRSGQLSDQTHPNPFDFQRWPTGLLGTTRDVSPSASAISSMTLSARKTGASKDDGVASL